MSDVTTNESSPQVEIVQRGSFALTVRRLRGDGTPRRRSRKAAA